MGVKIRASVVCLPSSRWRGVSLSIRGIPKAAVFSSTGLGLADYVIMSDLQGYYLLLNWSWFRKTCFLQRTKYCIGQSHFLKRHKSSLWLLLKRSPWACLTLQKYLGSLVSLRQNHSFLLVYSFAFWEKMHLIVMMVTTKKQGKCKFDSYLDHEQNKLFTNDFTL